MIVEDVDLELIDDNPRQPRKLISDEKLAELVTSIETHGLLQPIIGQRLENGRVLCVAGHRRKKAYLQMGRPTIPTILLPESTNERNAILAIIENKERESLHFIDLADAVADVFNDEGKNKSQTARTLNLSLEVVNNLLFVASLPTGVKDTAKAYQTSMTELLVIGRLPDEKTMVEALAAVRRGIPLTAVLEARKASSVQKSPQVKISNGNAREEVREKEKPQVLAEDAGGQDGETARAFVAKAGTKPTIPQREIPKDEVEPADQPFEPEPEIKSSRNERSLSEIGKPDQQFFRISIRNPDRQGESLEVEVTVSIAVPKENTTAEMVKEALANCFDELDSDGKLVRAITTGRFDAYSLRRLRYLIRESQGGAKKAYRGDVEYLRAGLEPGKPPTGEKVIELAKIIWETVVEDPETLFKLLGLPVSLAENPERFSEQVKKIEEFLAYRLKGQRIDPPPGW